MAHERSPITYLRSVSRKTILRGLIEEIDTFGTSAMKLYASLLAQEYIAADDRLRRDFSHQLGLPRHPTNKARLPQPRPVTSKANKPTLA